MARGNCRICDKLLSYGNQSGLCRAHWAVDPEQQGKRITALKMAFASRPELVESQRQHLANLNRTPEARARSGQQARHIKLWEYGLPKVDAEVRKRQIATLRERKLAHVPADYRDLYQELTRKARIPAAEALEAVLNQQAADLERFRREIAA